jgi:hypothetical protein
MGARLVICGILEYAFAGKPRSYRIGVVLAAKPVGARLAREER